MTSDYSIILPLMITSIVSTIVSSKLSRESIYSLKLVRRGIHVKEGAEINVMKSLFVKQIYTKQCDTIQENSTFDQVVHRVVSGNDIYFPVINKKGLLRGIISMHDIKEHLFDREILQHLLIAGDIANKDVETVSVNDNCQDVIDTLGRLNIEGIPVVDPKKPKQVLGMIWRSDILDAYNREIKKRDITSSYASQITMKNIDREVHFIEGYSMTEIPVPPSFVGKSIKELNIRAEYGVDILLIRTNTGEGSKIKSMPSADYVFSYDDSIVISGEIGKINMLKHI
jgi:CIC family chloride channel protein